MKRVAVLATALAMVFALALTGCGGSGQGSSSSSGAAAPESSSASSAASSAESSSASGDGMAVDMVEIDIAPDWVSNLPDAQDAKQLFVVGGVGKTTATIGMYEKDDQDTWRTIVTTPGYIGMNGLGKTKEGDAKTPIGTFKFNKAFGIAADPGCAIEYTQVTEDNYWSGDDRAGMHYNELVDIKDLPDLDVEASEHIVDYTKHYQYCMNISYNDKGEAGLGSAIFLHCFGPNKPYTGGCVAIPQDIMVQVMKAVDPECVVVIDSLESMGGTLDLPDENTYLTVGSLEAALEYSGVSEFTAPEDIDTDLGEVGSLRFKAKRMEGIEAVYEIAAAEIDVFKGAVPEEGDVTGTDEKYKNTWTQKIDGIEVTCFGNRKGEAQKALWEANTYAYGMTATGLGGDDDFGLDKDRLEAFVTAVK